ncbi:MAG: 1,3-beta-galactosyl-N-acetylhexosamine phosphorylase [Phycisphaerae bacterium]|jgi:1,3-beta-galactosyl-N-acetylhexosamine phosphorylase
MSGKGNLTGHFTLPAQKGMDKEVQMLCKKWGADAIRDSDGTTLSPEILNLGHEVYSTICLIRADQQWAQAHPDQCQQKYLMSFPVTSQNGGELRIKIQKGYSHEQFKIDSKHDPKKYWEVIDRTIGQVVSISNWRYLESSQEVLIRNADKWHIYTVNFLVYQIWETTSMYNYITNNWTGEHQMGVDPRQPQTYKHLLEYLDQWLQSHSKTDVVRFTSMMYQFPLIKNENRETIYLEWTGYMDAMSALAMDEFEKEKGYRLRSEDIVDEGYFNNSCRVPKPEFLDWMGFVQKFVRGYTKQCVEMVHKYGKKAVLFFCDHWIGTEPYMEGFEDLGFDGIIGPCLSGVELRRITDVPGNAIKEVRLYPYFFEVNLQDEPVFKDGGDPVKECKKWWKGIRRALLRRCADRIGFGGYLDLAMKYPDFIDYVGQLADEFRTVLDRTKKTPAYNIGKKVAVLDVWGKLRSWMHNENWPQGHIPECLCGLPVEVEFISFDDIRKNGISDDIGIIINWGRANSAWSGGENWIDIDIVEKIRQWVHKGGGFIGVEDPTAYEYQGRCFQLADVLGVQKETGNTLGWGKNIKPAVSKTHFILEDAAGNIDFGVSNSAVYLNSVKAELLAGNPDKVLLSTHTFGKGKAVYLADYKHNPENIRMVHRAILWAAGLENKLKIWFSSNYNTDCAYYPEVKEFVVMNNTDVAQKTTVYNAEGKSGDVSLKPMEIRWFTLDQINQNCTGSK